MSSWLKNNLGVIPFDPYNKPVHNSHQASLEDDDNFEKRHHAKRDGDFNTVRELMKPVVAMDLRMVDHSDFIICNFDLDSHPCGTFDEIFMAADENKPVIIMCPQGKRRIYDWMFGRFRPEMFFDNWGDVKKYLLHIAFDPQVDTLNKWKFFDIEKIIIDIVKQDYDLIAKDGDKHGSM